MLRSLLLLLLLLLLLAASLLCAPASAGDIDAQAERLAALRGEVETISAELELDKADLRSRLRAVEAQTVDLEVQIRREELRLERLLTEEEKQRSLLDEAAGTEDLTPTVTA
ncbi:MAG: TolA-binding protein, partial [Myxococcota bacterium]